MVIKNEYPPLIDAIDAAFNVRGKPIVFAYGDTIYNPRGGELSPCIVAHEGVHGERQLAYDGRGGDPVRAWWYRYIAEPEFRLAEEIPAHVREYVVFGRAVSRHERRFYLTHVAQKLSSDLYGNLITFADAKALIKREARLEAHQD